MMALLGGNFLKRADPCEMEENEGLQDQIISLGSVAIPFKGNPIYLAHGNTILS